MRHDDPDQRSSKFELYIINYVDLYHGLNMNYIILYISYPGLCEFIPIFSQSSTCVNF